MFAGISHIISGRPARIITIKRNTRNPALEFEPCLSYMICLSNIADMVENTEDLQCYTKMLEIPFKKRHYIPHKSNTIRPSKDTSNVYVLKRNFRKKSLLRGPQ